MVRRQAATAGLAEADAGAIAASVGDGRTDGAVDQVAAFVKRARAAASCFF